jgi:hypothetical protein
VPQGFKLIPAEIPQKSHRGTDSYRAILEAFMDSGEKSVRVELPGRKPTTVLLGLRKALKDGGEDVAAIQRGDAVFLLKQ